MYFDLENLIKRFRRAMKNLPVNDEGKHVTTVEDVIDYLKYLIDDDDYFCEEDEWNFDEDDEYEDEEEDEDD